MKPSTVLELCGFGLITYAAYTWNTVAGLAIGGAFLLLIGYATEDNAAIVVLSRPVKAVRGRLERSKAKRRSKKAG